MSDQARPGQKNQDYSNVVQLNPERNAPAAISLTRLPAAMHSLRDKARQHLQGLLRDLFDKVDDAMFELADKASSNHEQNIFFDSMREVRLRRRAVETSFFRSIDIRFAQLLDHNAYRDELPIEQAEVSLDDISLVKNDDLEEMVAVTGMINKANEQFAEPIQHLTMRIDHLVPLKVYQKNNPVGVDVICNAFNEASKSLDVDVKAKLVLFKLFDNMVMAKLGGLFQALNQLLVENNILPSLKSAGRTKLTQSPRSEQDFYGAGLSQAAHERSQDVNEPSQSVSASSNTHSNSQRSSGQQATPVYDEQTNSVLHTLRDLLGSRNQNAPARAATGEEIATQELVKILSEAQQNNSRYQAANNSGLTHLNLRELLQDVLRSHAQSTQAINQVDDDVINLVSMMFDFILDDRNLASPMKALIGRLQIPMVKVAIADKSFFSKGGHPARRLLNEMAMAALGWQESNDANHSVEGQRKDSLYSKMESIVQTILTDFDTDMSIFNNLLTDFRAFLEKDKRRAQILEQRTLDAEDGKAKTERARSQVDSVLNRITSGYDLPEHAQKLLRDAWGNVLFITFLKQGVESAEWQSVVRSAQQLVWSLTAPMTKDNRQALLKLMPDLLQKLRAGLESISYSPFETTQLFKQLEVLHVARLRAIPKVDDAVARKESVAPATQTANNEVRKVPVADTPSSQSAKTSEVKTKPHVKENVVEQPVQSVQETAILTQQNSGSEAQALVSQEVLAAPVQQAVGPTELIAPTNEQVVDSFVVLGEEIPTLKEASLPEGDQHLGLVSNLTQGSWFEMQSDDGQKFRCRLAAIIRATGKYIFVNRSGVKVAEETRMSLALALKSGRLQVLDDGMLFDRALEAVIGNLRSNR